MQAGETRTINNLCCRAAEPGRPPLYCSSPKEDWSSVAALSQMLACPASSLAWAHGLDHPSAARCYLDVASALVYRWRQGMLGEVLLHLPIMAVVPTSFGAACPATHIYHWSLGWPLAFTSARRWHVRLHCQIDGYASKNKRTCRSSSVYIFQIRIISWEAWSPTVPLSWLFICRIITTFDIGTFVGLGQRGHLWNGEDFKKHP